MAARKTAETPMEEKEILQTEEPIQPAQEADPWSVMHKITLPRASAGEEATVFAAVNGRSFFIPRGKTTEVPEPIYLLLRQSEAAMNMVEDFQNQIPNRS